MAKRLQGLALLQRMLYPTPGREGSKATVTVTLTSGQVVTGRLAYRDEFTIGLTDSNGWYRAWPTRQVTFVSTIRCRPMSISSASTPTGTCMTSSRTCRRFAKGDGASLLLSPAFCAASLAQSLDPSALLKPPADSWPTYHGDYSGQRHSRLTQITPANVHQLTLAWAFQTNQPQQIKATPILANGVIYITTPDNLWAIDARSARQIWRYTYPANDGFHIGHRGVAVYKDFVYMTTPDAHLVALDARDGKVRWNVEIADAKRGFWSTNAPLVVRNHLIVGVAGDFDNLPGTLKSFDPDTGKLQWTFYSTPPPGTPGSQSGGATGGQMWMTGTYDPELNLVYVGTGNPTPVLNGPARPGDNPWTCSIVALNPDTGTLVWGFQASPHDTHDWDAAEVPVLVDAHFNGAPRKLLLQASRNGYYFVLDRTTGKSLVTTPFATVNWAKEYRQGRPADSRSGQGAGARRTARRAERSRRQPTIGRRASIPRPACSSSVRRTRTGSTSSRPSTARTAGRARTTACGAKACCARSTIRPARSAGATTSARARAARVS